MIGFQVSMISTSALVFALVFLILGTFGEGTKFGGICIVVALILFFLGMLGIRISFTLGAFGI